MTLRSIISVFAFSLLVGGASAQDKKSDKVKEPMKGSVSGVVASKGEAWIEVKTEGEARPRRYIARWKDAADTAKIKDVPLGAQVKLEWTLIDSRPRVDKIEFVSSYGNDKKPDPEKKADNLAPPPRVKP